MSLTQGGQQLPSASVLPGFEGDISSLRQMGYGLGGQTTPQGALSVSPAMQGAANVGNNYFGPGGLGTSGMGYLNNVLQGNYLTPASNPYLQGTIQSMQQAFGKTLGTAEDSLNSQFIGAGQTGDSGARINAMTQLGTNALQNFGNSLTGFLGQNFMNEQGLQNQALGMMNQPLQGAGMASAFGQAPGMQAVQGQQYQNELAQLPIQAILQMLQSAPVSNPQYAPSQPSEFGSWMNFISGLAQPAATAYAGRNG